MAKIPVMHHHRASGRARVYFKGKHIYLGKWQSPEAQAAYSNFLRQIQEIGAPIVKGGGLPVCVAVGKFLDYAKDYYQGRHEVQNLKSTLKVFVDFYEWQPITEVGPLKIIAMMDALAKQKENRTRINRILNHIKRLFDWLVSRELIGAEKLSAVRAVKSLRFGRTTAQELPPIPAVPVRIVEQTLKGIGKPLSDMIQIQLLTAMRPKEVCSLNFTEIDQSQAVWIYEPKNHKTAWRGHARKIWIGPEAQALLKPYSFMPKDKPIFYTSKNEAFNTLTYGRAISEHNRKNKIPRWNPNQLRHAAATKLVKEFGWQAARLILGHKAFDTTLIYAEENFARAVEIIGKIG